VPVLNQRVFRQTNATAARRSPLAVRSGSENLAMTGASCTGSEGNAAAAGRNGREPAQPAWFRDEAWRNPPVQRSGSSPEPGDPKLAPPKEHGWLCQVQRLRHRGCQQRHWCAHQRVLFTFDPHERETLDKAEVLPPRLYLAPGRVRALKPEPPRASSRRISHIRSCATPLCN